MGATASKPARSAVGAASRRQYPKKASPGTTKVNAQQPPQQQTSRASGAAPTHGPTYHSNEQASALRSEAIDLDARDPHFAASLRSIGPVIPNPTFSNSSTFHQRNFQNNSASAQQTQNTSAVSIPPGSVGGGAPSVFPDANNNPALLVLSSRARIARAAEQEVDNIGRRGYQGREFLDAMTIRQILTMRDRQRISPEEIERLLSLKTGVVERLGEKGVVSEAF